MAWRISLRITSNTQKPDSLLAKTILKFLDNLILLTAGFIAAGKKHTRHPHLSGHFFP